MVAVDGGPVVPHAQAFADEINRRWGFTHILTYPGHEPDQQHALDNFQTRAVMLQLANWCTRDDVIDHFGLDYVIFNVDESTNAGEIYNREIARRWRTMQDRGSPTQNHHDHVHVSFNKTGSATPFGGSVAGPVANPTYGEQKDMVCIFQYGNRLYIGVLGAWRSWIPTPGVFEMLVRHGTPVNNTDGTAIIQKDIFEATPILGTVKAE